MIPRWMEWDIERKRQERERVERPALEIPVPEPRPREERDSRPDRSVIEIQY